MNDEEIKAIEYWKEKLKDYKKEIIERQNDEFKGYGTLEDIAKLKYCNLQTVLNLIEKQKEEIKEKDEYLELISKQLDNIAIDQIQMAIEELYIYLDKYKKEIETLKRDFEIVDHECSRLEQEDIRKDKQIEQYINMLATNDMLHVLECEKKDKIIDLMAKFMEEEMYEYQLDNIYAELHNCNGLERNWTRGKEAEIKDIKEYFENKVKESK